MLNTNIFVRELKLGESSPLPMTMTVTASAPPLGMITDTFLGIGADFFLNNLVFFTGSLLV